MNNYTDLLFDSISLIVENRIANLDYDKTIICTVIDNSNSKNDIYIVSDGNIKFEAFGQGNFYLINDTVRVEVSNGDWSKPKFIQGKYSSENDIKPVTYISPLNSLLKLTDNLISDPETFTPNNDFNYGIAANISQDTEKISSVKIGTIDLSKKDIQNSDIFNTLYIQADFQTMLDKYDIRSGDYGIIIKLNITDDNGKNKAFKFSAIKDMFGNPYAFTIFTTQEKIYQLSSLDWTENLTTIDLYIYEDNNFTYYNDSNGTIEKLPLTLINGIDTAIENIKIQNIQLGFGSEISSIRDNSIKIYTNDSDTFTVKSNDPPADPDKKIIKLLWYNKTENNEYIGFSDGKVDPPSYSELGKTYDHYDEIAYLEEIRENNRLIKHKDTEIYDDNLSLSLAADATDIEKIGKDLSIIIGKNLFNELRRFKEYIQNLDNDIDNLIKEMLDATNDADNNKSLSKISYNIYNSNDSGHSQILRKKYTEILQAAKKKTQVDVDIQQLHNNILLPLYNIFDLFGYTLDPDKKSIVLDIEKNNDSNKIMPYIENIIKTQYISRESTYNSYKTRIEKVLNQIFNKLNVINELLMENDSTNEAKLLELNSGNYAPGISCENLAEKKEFIESWDNRYCIYWYRQNLNYTDPDGILPPGWERINSQDNCGIPSEEEDSGFYKKRGGAIDCEFVLNNYVQTEKIKAVLYYNHEKFISNTLEFNNAAIVTDSNAIDANGALYIEHYNEASKDSYQLYHSSGLLINAADTQQKRELRVRFNGETGKDEQLIGSTVCWYVPKNSTMLEVFDSDVKDFYTDRIKIFNSLSEFEGNCKRDLITNYANYLVKIKNEKNPDDEKETGEWRVYVVTDEYRTYPKGYLTVNSLNSADKTKEQLVQNAKNPLDYDIYKYNDKQWVATGGTVSRFIHTTVSNDITEKPDVVKDRADSNFYKDGYYYYYKVITATVTENGDNKLNENDTIFTYHIKDYYLQTATQNEIDCEVIKDGKKYYAEKYFTFSSFGNNGTDYTLTLLPDPQQNAVTANHPLDININLYDYNNNQLAIIENTYKNVDDNKPALWWEGPTGYAVDLDKDDESNLIGCKVSKLDNNIYAGILKCEVKNTEIEQLNNKKINLISYLPLSFSDNLNQYIEGATTVIYDSNGSNPQYYKKPYKLYESVQNTQIQDVEWDIEYYLNKTVNWTYLDSTEVTTINFSKFTIDNENNIPVAWWYIDDGNNKKQQSLSLIPEVLGQGESNSTKENRIADQKNVLNSLSLNYLLKLNSEDNTLIPGVMYIDNLNIYPVITAKNKTTKELLWAQPILIIQNRYASPMLNSWDGSLQIDEENNTIMSMMVGAGRKNNNNQFEGVLMGDVRTGTEDDATAIGLYGFHEGAQSFGFKIDGTAFLGKSSGGRIYMDGNNGFIASGNWLSSGGILNSDGTLGGSAEFGMAIDLQEGHIDAYNFKLTSGSFILDSTGQNNYKIIDTVWNNISDVILGVNKKFALTKDGDLYASNVNLSGVIDAQAGGSIGGWEIGNNHLITKNYGLGAPSSFHMYSNVNGIQGTIASHTPTEGQPGWMLGIGDKFGVLSDGTAHCKNVIATGGQIGGFKIEGDNLNSSSIALSPTQVYFPSGSQLNLGNEIFINDTTKDPITNVATSYISTKSARNFEIKNGAGAGLRFLANTTAQKVQATLTLYEATVIEEPEGPSYGGHGYTYQNYAAILYVKYKFTNVSGELTALSEAIQVDFFITYDGILAGNDPKYEKKTFTIAANTTSGTFITKMYGWTAGGTTTLRPSHDSSKLICWTESGTYRTSLTRTEISIDNTNTVLYSLGSFYPTSTSCLLGVTAQPWGSVASETPVIVTSDRKAKNTLSEVASIYTEFFDLLKPVTYKYNKGTSDRLHTGFIAQDIEQALYEVNLTTKDFAGICIENDSYALRYEEFIPLNTWQIQKLKPRMTEAEERIYKLEQELAELKSKLT